MNKVFLELEVIQTFENVSIWRNSIDSDFWVLCEKKDDYFFEPVYKKDFQIFSKLVINNKPYEAIKIKRNTDLDFILAFAQYLNSLSVDFSKSIKLIERFLMKSNSVNLEWIRGAWAELYFIENDPNIKPRDHHNSIYDFEINFQDLEVKSTSNNSVFFSPQQITNNPKANLWILQLRESNQGESLREKIIRLGMVERFRFIDENESKFLDQKFIVVREKRTFIEEITKMNSLPKNVIGGKLCFSFEW